MLTPFEKILATLRPLRDEDKQAACRLRLFWNSKAFLRFLWEKDSIPNDAAYHYLSIALYDYGDPNENPEEIMSLNQERIARLCGAVGLRYTNPYIRENNNSSKTGS